MDPTIFDMNTNHPQKEKWKWSGSYVREFAEDPTTMSNPSGGMLRRMKGRGRDYPSTFNY